MRAHLVYLVYKITLVANFLAALVSARQVGERIVNGQNATHELLRWMKNPSYEVTLLDIYIMLFSFIERHCNDHIFVDEMSIAHSKFCKLDLL